MPRVSLVIAVMALVLRLTHGLRAPLGAFSLKGRGTTRRFLATNAEAADILKEVETQADVSMLWSILELQGFELLDMKQREKFHPLVVPLAKDPEDKIIGVLRWATPEEGKPLPVVKTEENSPGVELLSQSAELYAKRVAIEAFSGGEENAANLVNAADALGLVQAWEADARKDVTLFTMLKVGPFPDLYRKQALKHFEGGSHDSALVACERANDLFKGWGAAYAFYASLMMQLPHRSMESRDAARVALRMPVWSLGGALGDGDYAETVAKVAKLADYTGTEALRLMYSKLADDKREEEVQGGRLPEQVALDRAAFYMDAVACGLGKEDGSWESKEVRGKLADLYREAKLDAFADFVDAST